MYDYFFTVDTLSKKKEERKKKVLCSVTLKPFASEMHHVEV